MVYTNIDKLIFSNVIKYVRPTYSNKEELSALFYGQIEIHFEVGYSHSLVSLSYQNHEAK